MGLKDFFRKKTGTRGIPTFDISAEDDVQRKVASLCEKRQACEVLVGNDIYSSQFLSSTTDRFFIDMMIPLVGNAKIMNGSGVNIGFLERRIPYNMFCEYIGREMFEGFEALTFRYPRVVRYSNRRSYFRVRPSISNPIRLYMDFGTTNMIESKAEDISGGGLSFKGQLASFLKLGANLERIDIALPSGEWVSCRGTVVRIKGTIIGIEIDDMSFNDRRKIIKYVAERQQAQISHQTEE